MDASLQLLLLAAFPALVLVAAVKDLVSYTIPNWISLALAGLFIPVALVVGVGLDEIARSAAVGLVLLAAGVGMYAMGWVGGGDAKLMAAAGLWLGWPTLLHFILFTALAGGALALLLLSARNTPLVVLTLRGPGWVQRLAEKGGPAPYGVAICFGALAAFPMSALVTAAGVGL
jgi:prepilin peptidase CpaA